MVIKAVFFDWDFTLVDPKPALEKMLDDVYARNKIKKRYELSELLPLTTMQVIKKLGLSRYSRIYLLYEYIKLTKKYSRLFKFKGKEILRFLEDKKIPYVIITDNFSKAIRKNFPVKPVLIEDYLRTRGNKYRGIKKGLKKLKLKPHEVIYVGDKPSDVKYGRKAGVFTAAILTTNTRKDFTEYQPDMFISDINQLKKLFKDR